MGSDSPSETLDHSNHENKTVPKWKIWFYLLLLGFAVMLQFTAFFCSTNLLSSVEIDEGLGVWSQFWLYIAFTISALFLPPLAFRIAGVKVVIGVSILLYSMNIGAYIDPKWESFIPMAVITGIAASTFWSGMILYVKHLADLYTDDKEKVGHTVITFMGVIEMFLSSCNIWGNVLSYEILKPVGGYSEMNISEHDYSLCGINFCDEYATGGVDILQQPSHEKMTLLMSIFIGIIILAGLLVLIFLRPMPKGQITDSSFLQLIVGPIKCLRDPLQLLLAPIEMLASMGVLFIATEYTKGFIACSWGIHHIGYVMVAYGVSAAVTGFVVGFMEKLLGRIILISTAMILYIACILVFWLWAPTPQNTVILFVVAAVWGCAGAITNPTVRAIYGTFFTEDKESSLALMAVFESLGCLIIYSFSSKLCMKPKTIIFACILLVSWICYLIGEAVHRRRVKNRMETNHIGLGDPISQPNLEINGPEKYGSFSSNL